jgi:hypothetical protein
MLRARRADAHAGDPRRSSTTSMAATRQVTKPGWSTRGQTPPGEHERIPPAHAPPWPPSHEERQLTVIWRATVRDGLLTLWQIIEDTPAQRALLGLAGASQAPPGLR